MGALCIATRGMICTPKTINVTVCEKPEMGSVIEVRPRIRQVAGPEEIAGDAPMILSGQELHPQLRTIEAAVSPPSPKPNIIETEELKPVIRKVEED